MFDIVAQQVWLAPSAADMRKSIDGLAGIAQFTIKLDRLSPLDFNDPFNSQPRWFLKALQHKLELNSKKLYRLKCHWAQLEATPTLLEEFMASCLVSINNIFFEREK